MGVKRCPSETFLWNCCRARFWRLSGLLDIVSDLSDTEKLLEIAIGQERATGLIET